MDKTSPQISNLSAWLILIFLSLIWGSSFILIKKSLLAFSPDEVGALRIFIAALAFIPFAIVKWKNVDWSLSKYYLIVGVFGNAIPAYLFALAETELSSSVAGVLNGLTPLFTLLFGVLIFGSKFKALQYLGVLIGFTGAALLMLYGSEIEMSQSLKYGLLIVLGTMCYAISVNTVNKYLSHSDAILISTISFMFIGPFAFFYLCSTNVLSDISTDVNGSYFLLMVCLLSLFSTVLATIVFFRLVQLTNALYSSSVAFMIPVVALGWGLADGEYLSLVHLGGMALILSGVYLIRR